VRTKISLANEMGYASEVMCYTVDKSFDYVLLPVIFLGEAYSLFLCCYIGCYETLALRLCVGLGRVVL
jgi:hypothetical protein